MCQIQTNIQNSNILRCFQTLRHYFVIVVDSVSESESVLHSINVRSTRVFESQALLTKNTTRLADTKYLVYTSNSLNLKGSSEYL